MRPRPNHALQRTWRGVMVCNPPSLSRYGGTSRGLPWAESLSLGR